MFIQCIHQKLLCIFLVKSSYAHLKSVFYYKKRNTHTHIHVHKHIIKSKSINTTIFWNVSSVIWRETHTHTQCKDTETHNQFQSQKLNQTETKRAEEFCGLSLEHVWCMHMWCIRTHMDVGEQASMFSCGGWRRAPGVLDLSYSISSPSDRISQNLTSLVSFFSSWSA